MHNHEQQVDQQLRRQLRAASEAWQPDTGRARAELRRRAAKRSRSGLARRSRDSARLMPAAAALTAAGLAFATAATGTFSAWLRPGEQQDDSSEEQYAVTEPAPNALPPLGVPDPAPLATRKPKRSANDPTPSPDRADGDVAPSPDRPEVNLACPGDEIDSVLHRSGAGTVTAMTRIFYDRRGKSICAQAEVASVVQPASLSLELCDIRDKCDQTNAGPAGFTRRAILSGEDICADDDKRVVVRVVVVAANGATLTDQTRDRDTSFRLDC